jgi:hypothetical protein
VVLMPDGILGVLRKVPGRFGRLLAKSKSPTI